MQVFDLMPQMKNMFNLRGKPGGVLSGVSIRYQDSSNWPK